jgi:cyd operon protein YbgT
MWYFAWILGLGLACAFAILNAMWLELDEGRDDNDNWRDDWKAD